MARYKTYLGDSVYAEMEGEGLVLTTENGLPSDPSNVIILEPAVVRALEQFLRWENEDKDSKPVGGEEAPSSLFGS